MTDRSRSIWLTPRALRLHLALLIVVPACMALCIWQLDRALAGNTLSWAYVFEWPLFAGYAVYMWWRFVHEAPDEPPAAPARGGAAPQPTQPKTASQDDPELAAYNAYLAQLGERRRSPKH